MAHATKIEQPVKFNDDDLFEKEAMNVLIEDASFFNSMPRISSHTRVNRGRV